MFFKKSLNSKANVFVCKNNTINPVAKKDNINKLYIIVIKFMLRIFKIEVYLSKVFFRYFFLSLFVFSGIFFLFSFFKVISSNDIVNGISPYYFIRTIIYLIPNILIITIPFSVVFSIFFTVGDISLRGEVIAIKVGGFSYFEMVRLLFFYAVIFSIFYYILANYIEPVCSLKSREYLRIMMNRMTNVNIKPRVFQKISTFVIYSSDVDGNFMKDVIMLRDFESKNGDKHIFKVESKRGEFRFVKEKGLDIFLSDGSIMDIAKESSDILNKGSFKDYYVFIPFEFKEANYSIPYKHMSGTELNRILRYEKDFKKKMAIKKEIFSRINSGISIFLFFLVSIILSFYYERESKYFSFFSSLILLFFYYSLLIISDVIFRKNNHLVMISFIPSIFMLFFGFYFYFFKLRFK
jgi:lipopolysaccharide export system permease protein